MKKLALLLVSVLLISCTQSKEEQLVLNYEQRIGDTQTDFNLKFQKFEFVKDVIGKDSALILTEYFEENKLKKITFMLKEIQRNRKQIKIYEDIDSNSSAIDYLTDSYYKEIERCQSIIDLYSGDCKGTFLQPILKKINIV